MKAFSRAEYVRRKKNYEEGKNIFGEQISRAGEQIILFTQRNFLYGEACIYC